MIGALVDRRVLFLCLAILFLFAELSAAECVEVVEVVAAPVNSAPKVRVQVLLNGKPVNGSKLQINSDQKDSQQTPVFVGRSFVSDGDGVVDLPKLAPGHYHITALAEQNLRADLYLAIDPKPKQKASAFSMALQRYGDPTIEELASKAEQMPTADLVKQFRGTVTDLSGAVIPGARIEVVRRGTEGKDRVAHLQSGSNGEFSAEIADGSYIAIFSAQGFQTKVIPFDVSQAESDDLKVILNIGSC